MENQPSWITIFEFLSDKTDEKHINGILQILTSLKANVSLSLTMQGF
jgi:hypothetical protein